jgi:UDP-3-O-[3-hydroxymyristoyl] glucosamine N-acyltransferase
LITRTVSELAELCGAAVEGDGGRRVVGPASLSEARADQVSFLGNRAYAAELEATRAGAVVVPLDVRPRRRDLTLLRSANPNRAFSRVIESFRAPGARPEPGIHPSAVVAPDAEVDRSASVGPLCVVEGGARIGARCVLHGRVTVGRRSSVGEESELHPGVVLYAEVEVGKRCVLHAGAVLGADGFGFDPTPEGWEKVPQCGSVVVEDDVEIGANTAIDRGRFQATRILRGTKIDNLVHVAHNCVIGPDALLVAQVGIAGSSRVGARAVLGGQVGVGGHVEVGPGARVGGQAGVTKSIKGGRDYWGTPVREKGEVLRSLAWLGRVPELERRVAQLERREAARRTDGSRPAHDPDGG